MSSFNLSDVVQRLEKMASTLEQLKNELKDYHGNMKSQIDSLEQEGLPREFINRFREDHLEDISRYFNGLGDHIEQKSLPYTREVIHETEELANRIG